MSKKRLVLPSLLLLLVVAALAAPPVFARQLEEIGYFATSLLDNSANRVTNIKLAVAKIDNLELNPADVFSFNKIVGPRTKAAGFKLASIFENGKVVEDYGGGICQLATTVYQAALKAKLPVTEVHRHSLQVKYIGPGQDATVNWGSRDLKFVNTAEAKIIINCGLTADLVWVKISRLLPETAVTLYLDSEIIEPPVPPFYHNGTVFVPLRVLSEKLGFDVEWNDALQRITVRQKEVAIDLTIGQQLVTTNGCPYEIPAAPLLKDGTAMVPLRFIAEVLGKTVIWVEEEYSVYIKT